MSGNYPEIDKLEVLPPNWVKHKSKTRNRFFYFNIKTQASVWTLPETSKMDNKIKCAKSASPRKSSSVPFNESRGVIDSSKAIVKKNTAAERLKRLQAGLKNELNEGISLPKLVQKNKLTEAKGKLAQMIYKKPEVLGAAKIPINTNNNNSLNFVSPPAKWSSDIIKNLSEIPLPETNFDSSIYQAKTPQTPANNRLARLRTHLTAEQQKEQMDDNMDDSEAMEWEDVSEKTINIEVSKIRSSYNVSASSTSSFVVEIQSSGLSQVCNTDTSGAAAPLVIVVDTNVFLKNLPFIDELQGHYFNNLGTAIIYIPYIVLHELDSFKNSELSIRARRCINYINEQFKSKSPYMRGQTALEDEGHSFINATVPDDRILNACFQVKQFTLKVILLTNDHNLQNKALFNHIEAYSQDSLKKFLLNKTDQIKFSR